MNQNSLDVLSRELEATGPDLFAGGDLLRGILDGSGDCIKILDLEGRLQFMSEGGKRVMEVENFAALQGCPWPDFWVGEGNSQAHHAVAEAKAGRSARFQNNADTAKGTPRYWDVQVSPIRGCDGRITHLLSISRDITEQWRAVQLLRDNVEHQKFLTEELTHRVKNTLATVLAMANQSFRQLENKKPLETFSARVTALGDAYNILTESAWSATDMRAIVEAALAPYRSDAARFTLDGPALEVSPKQAITLALAINELATNAMKYGALSEAAGRIAITWRNDNGFAFEWRESQGPACMPPTRIGFGSRLIRNMLARDFNGSVDLLYPPEGLVCILKASRAP